MRSLTIEEQVAEQQDRIKLDISAAKERIRLARLEAKTLALLRFQMWRASLLTRERTNA